MRLLRRFLISTLLLQLATIVGAAAQVGDSSSLGWRTYVVPAHGTSVEFPAAIFMPAGSPAKGVGQRFKSSDARASLSIYALGNEPGYGPAGYLERNLQVANSAIEYRRVTRSFFAISMERNGLIYYSRCNFVRADRSIHCFDLEYPRADKSSWDPIVTRISLSLRPLEDSGLRIGRLWR
jgi:hypothetical protein